MGVLDKFLNFGNSRRGKLISFAIVALTLILFFIGVGMTAIGSASRPIRSLQLEAQNMRYGVVTDAQGGGNFTGYHLEVSQINTPITAVTDPLSHNTPITFSTQSPLVKINGERTAKTNAGGTVVITIQKIGGKYEFSHPDPQTEVDKIRIDVRCGNILRPIFVRIVLKQHAVEVNSYLESNLPFIPGEWSTVPTLIMDHFKNDENPLANPQQYRIRFEFKIFGEVIYDTVRDRNRITQNEDVLRIKTGDGENDYDYFSYTQLEEHPIAMDLFYELNNQHYLRLQTVTESMQIRFRVLVNFNGVDFFTEPPFVINVDAVTKIPLD